MYRYMNVTADALGWLATQRGWLEQQLAAPASQQEPFWVTIGLLMDQFHGMVKVRVLKHPCEKHAWVCANTRHARCSAGLDTQTHQRTAAQMDSP